MAVQGEVINPGDEGVEIPFSNDALAVLNKSEIEQQVEISKKYPRSIDKFRKNIDQYCCLTPAIALSMFYSLPRAGKQIVGPSVRMAETLLTCWGNSRAGLRIIGERGDVAIAQGLFFDCENNVGIAIEAARNILDKNGRKFNADMIKTTGDAAASVGYRNAIVRGIPRALWWDTYDKARMTAVGEAKSFVDQVNQAVEEFSKQGVTQVALLNMIGAPSLRDITADHILTLRTVFSEIKRGDKTVEDVFGSPEGNEIERIMDELSWNETKKRTSREAYKGKQLEHLDYLKEIAKKAGKGPVATTTTKAEPQQEKAAPKEEDTKTTANSTGTTEEASTSQESSKPAAEPEARKETSRPTPEPVQRRGRAAMADDNF